MCTHMGIIFQLQSFYFQEITLISMYTNVLVFTGVCLCTVYILLIQSNQQNYTPARALGHCKKIGIVYVIPNISAYIYICVHEAQQYRLRREKSEMCLKKIKIRFFMHQQQKEQKSLFYALFWSRESLEPRSGFLDLYGSLIEKFPFSIYPADHCHQDRKLQQIGVGRPLKTPTLATSDLILVRFLIIKAGQTLCNFLSFHHQLIDGSTCVQPGCPYMG